jgi:hypothetical protein
LYFGVFGHLTDNLDMPSRHIFVSLFTAGARLELVDRAHQLGFLRGQVAARFGSGHPLVVSFGRAVHDDRALAEGLVAFDRQPSVPRRQIIASFGRVMLPRWPATRPHDVAEPEGRFTDLPPPAASGGAS